jgi:5-methylcytosine-specific restriction endonuclease McrA
VIKKRVFPLALFSTPCDKWSSKQGNKLMTVKHSFSPATKAAIRAKGNCCWACGVPGWIGIEVDHIIPRKNADGTPNINCNNGESNGQMLCSACNNVKSTVTFALAPRKPYWHADQVTMMKHINANRMKFATLIRKARARQ